MIGITSHFQRIPGFRTAWAMRADQWGSPPSQAATASVITVRVSSWVGPAFFGTAKP